MNEQTTLKTTDIAEELRVTPGTVRVWIRKGYLPAVKLGGTIRVYSDEYRAALEPASDKGEGKR